MTSTLPHCCRCGARWAGSRTAHCSACHATFSGVSLFIEHRHGGRCLDPVTLGMALVPARPYDCYGYPGAVGDGVI